jgi:hypothetical protein
MDHQSGRRFTRGEVQRTTNRLYALSTALLRAETAYEKYHEEATKLFNSGKTDDELVEDIPSVVARLENNTFLRTSALLSVYLGLLYTVVEGCRRWGFTDASINPLLASPFVQDLKDFRNAIFHVHEVTDPRVLQWGMNPERIAWSAELAARLRTLLLGLHETVAARIAAEEESRPIDRTGTTERNQ